MRHNGVRRFLPLVFFLLLVVAGVVYLARQSGAEAGPLRASGTVAAVEVVVGPEMAGRVAEVWVDEGQPVQEGDPLFRLDDALLRAQEDRVEAALQTAEAAVRTADIARQAAKVQYEMALQAARLQSLPGRLQGWRTAAPYQFTLPLWYFTPSEEITAAQQELEAAETAVRDEEAHLAEVVRASGGEALQQAVERLAQAQAAFSVAQDVLTLARAAREPQDLLDAAQELYDAAADELEAAQAAYDDALEAEAADDVLQARSRLAVARARLDAARDRLAQLQVGEHALTVEAARLGVEQAEAALGQAQAALAQARAEMAALQVQIDRLTVHAPVSGVVMTRSIEPGEVMMAGAAALTIGRLDELTITVYIPEDRYGQVRLGDSAEVSVDSFPGEVFHAVVVHIADRAEFTPRNVQTEEGRRTTVFAVDLRLTDPQGKLKPGMPADVVFLVQ